MKKQDAINLMFTEKEKKKLLDRMPDRWDDRPTYKVMVRSGLQERYVMTEEGNMVDLHHQSLITLRMALTRMANLLAHVKSEPNDQILGWKLRDQILQLENEFNIGGDQ